jgi:ABC-type bacteriocin/lantibiotic exporter with double-glycine peptidase domain
MLKSLINVYKLIISTSKKRRLQLCALIICSFTTIALDVLSLGAVVPFLAFVINPDLLTKKLGPQIAELSNAIPADKLGIIVALSFVIVYFLSSAFKTLNMYISEKIPSLIAKDLSVNSFINLLYMDYSLYDSLDHDRWLIAMSESLQRSVLAMRDFIKLVSSFGNLIIITIFVSVVSQGFSLIAIGIIGLFYIVWIRTINTTLANIGNQVVELDQARLLILRQTLSSIRDIIINNEQSMLEDCFIRNEVKLRRLSAKNSFLQGSPKYFAEALAISSIIIATILSNQYLRIDQFFIIANLTILALSAQKSLPLIQQIFSSLANISSTSNDVSLVRSVSRCQQTSFTNRTHWKDTCFKSKITIDNLSFCYPGSNARLISGLNFTIQKGDWVGIKGYSGCGKSTLLDIIMGLHAPSEGKIAIDGVDLINYDGMSMSATQLSLFSHVPQEIFMYNASIERNITLSNDLEFEKLHNVCLISGLADYVNSLPNGFKTVVGERGATLSGGLKQRIGLARALYQEREVLVLDEATSALDPISEINILDRLSEYKNTRTSNNLTILMVSHNHSNLKYCNRVLCLGDCNADVH